MRVIGLTGKARAGKDTVAQMILRLEPGARRQGFADKLKLSAARLLRPDITTAEEAIEFCDWLKTRGKVTFGGFVEGMAPISGRQFLQRYGTEAHREVFGEDFWLDAVLPEGRDDCDLLVVPDVRFENEARRVLDRGGQVWQINRPGINPVEAHASEGGVSGELIGCQIDNSGSLRDLEREVARALSAIRSAL